VGSGIVDFAVALAVLPELPAELFSCRSETLDPTPPTRASGGAPETILVVEDDRAIRYLFTHVLEGSGYAVIACEDGMHGLEVASSQIDRIDAVITDSRMPGLTGCELITRIRAMRPEMPVVVVSGNVDRSGTSTAEEPGIVRLSKPVSPDRLRRELRRLLTPGVRRAPKHPAVSEDVES
jgi:CheY-like chemotaxis protein